MAEFKKNTRFSGSAPRRPFTGGSNRSFGSRPSGNGFGTSGNKEMFEAECNSCHKKCQVPFRPNGKKPVYCSDCFRQEGGDRAEQPRFEKREYNNGPSRDFKGPSRDSAPMQPRIDDRRLDDLKRQLDTINATLEKLAASIDASTRASALTKEVRKHVPADKPAQAPVKVAAAKKPVKKAAKAAKKA